MQTFVVKLASGLAALVASVCLQLCNLSDNMEGLAEKVSTSSVLGLRMTMTVIPVIGLVMAVFYFKNKYILNEEKLEEICKKIKNKSGE